jgi:hypothetical protein
MLNNITSLLLEITTLSCSHTTHFSIHININSSDPKPKIKSCTSCPILCHHMHCYITTNTALLKSHKIKWHDRDTKKIKSKAVMCITMLETDSWKNACFNMNWIRAVICVHCCEIVESCTLWNQNTTKWGVLCGMKQRRPWNQPL